MFGNTITEIEELAPTIVMFSKTGCPSCEEAMSEFEKIDTTGTYRAYICKPSGPLLEDFKHNPILLSRRQVITFPTFVLYNKGKLVREYFGPRTSESMIQHLEDLTVHTSRLNDKISSIFPIQCQWLYDLYISARDCFWIEKEIDFSKDPSDWATMSSSEKYFIENILAFFALSDQIVNINIGERFQQDVDNIPKYMRTYARMFYNFQMAMEDIHSQTYETMLNVLVKDKHREAELKAAIATVPAIKKKTNWATKWVDSDMPFMVRLVAFAVLEGVFFSGSFAAIFWLRERNLLKGLTKSNEFIARDESMHYMFAIHLFNHLSHEEDYIKEHGTVESYTIHEIVKEAVEIESEFITRSFQCSMVGMNSDSMVEYIKFVADKLLSFLNVPKLYGSKNPFLFMENINLDLKSNFFEERVSQYAKANSAATGETHAFDDDF